jgi:hypothetical protein
MMVNMLWSVEVFMLYVYAFKWDISYAHRYGSLHMIFSYVPYLEMLIC